MAKYFYLDLTNGFNLQNIIKISSSGQIAQVPPYIYI